MWQSFKPNFKSGGFHWDTLMTVQILPWSISIVSVWKQTFICSRSLFICQVKSAEHSYLLSQEWHFPALLSLAGKNKSITSARLSPVYTLSPFPVTSIKTKRGFSRLPVSPLKQEGGKLNAYKQILWSDKRWHLLLTDLLAAKVCECTVTHLQVYNTIADLLRGFSLLGFCKCLVNPNLLNVPFIMKEM